MEAMEALLTRRSIRHFTSEQIQDDIFTEILEAAMCAPSAGNQQPWRFALITDRDLLDAIPDVHPYARMCREAQAAILVCGDLELEKHEGFWVQDCSAATQNLLLAAHVKGLGAVWLGVYPRDERIEGLRKLLKVPSNIIPFALIAVGYPDEKKGRENRFRSDRIIYNTW